MCARMYQEMVHVLACTYGASQWSAGRTAAAAGCELPRAWYAIIAHPFHCLTRANMMYLPAREERRQLVGARSLCLALLSASRHHPCLRPPNGLRPPRCCRRCPAVHCGGGDGDAKHRVMREERRQKRKPTMAASSAWSPSLALALATCALCQLVAGFAGAAARANGDNCDDDSPPVRLLDRDLVSRCQRQSRAEAALRRRRLYNKRQATATS